MDGLEHRGGDTNRRRGMVDEPDVFQRRVSAGPKTVEADSAKLA